MAYSSTIDTRLTAITDCLYRVSAKAIIIQDHKVLLVQEKEKHWSLPGGGIDYGENILTALKRELSEELGIAPEKVVIHDQVLQVTTGVIVDQIPRVALVYRADIPVDSADKTDHVLGYEWYDLQDIEHLTLSPIVRHTKELLLQLAG